MANEHYVAVSDNGSGDAHIMGICSSKEQALKLLQKNFLEQCSDDPEDLEGVVDQKEPTLEEMNSRVPGYGVMIIIVPDGVELYEELRSWDFKGCEVLGGHDHEDDDE